MSKSWEYANHVQKVREYGGPKAYERVIRESAFNAGYLAGRTEGMREGVLYMLPFVAGCGYLAYEKLPVLWRKIKARIDYTDRQEFSLEEHQTKGKNLNLEPVCPVCRECSNKDND